MIFIPDQFGNSSTKNMLPTNLMEMEKIESVFTNYLGLPLHIRSLVLQGFDTSHQCETNRIFFQVVTFIHSTQWSFKREKTGNHVVQKLDQQKFIKVLELR